MLDCQWLQQLVSYGLLSGAFRPKEEICALRAYMRQRSMLLADQARHVQHMQKALTQMNIQLANVISDVAGQTGQAIIRAIVAGERDGAKLATLRNNRIRASEAVIARALQGSWRAEHLFALRQALELFDAYAAHIAACDRELEAHLGSLTTREDDPPPSKRGKRMQKNAPRFDARTQLFRMCGVDLTQIEGIDVTTALKVMSEVGPDMSRFPSGKHFASWLGVCPGTRISGGKVLSGTTKRTANRAAQALRIAAAGLRTSQSALGAWFRRQCAKHDTPHAIKMAAHKMAAHKLARLIYALLTKGQQYVDQGMAAEEARHRDRQLRNLTKRAAVLGFALTATERVAVS